MFNYDNPKIASVMKKWWHCNLKVIILALSFFSFSHILFSQQSEADTTKINELIQKHFEIKFIYPDSSLKLILEAKKLSENCNYEYLRAKALQYTGIQYYVLGNYSLSFANLSQSLEIYLKLNDKWGESKSLNNLGLVYTVVGNIDKAIEYHRKSLQLCLEIGNKKLMPANYHNLAINFLEKDNYDSAIIYTNTALNIYKNTNRTNKTYQLYNLKGRIYAKAEKYDLAQKLFERTINQEDNLWEQTFGRIGMAELYLFQKNYDSSIKQATIAYISSVNLKTQWDIRESASLLASAYEKTLKYDSAYKYLKISKQINDSIITIELKDQFDNIDIITTEHRNNQLKKEKEIQSQKIKYKNSLIYAFIITSLVMLIFIYVYFTKNRQNKKLSNNLKESNALISFKNKELKKLNKTKDLMFRVIAHDLMGPISSVISFTDYISKNKEVLSEKNIHELFEKLNISVNRAYQLLDNLLNWARFQMEDSGISIIDINISEFLNLIISNLSQLLKEKNINLEINIEEETEINTDKNILQAVIRNLLSNAIKFTPVGGNIIINGCIIKDELEIEIKDNGIGMTKEQINLLFGSNPGESSIGTEGEKGSGIGFTLCRDFVKLLNGHIWVESKLNSGTSVFFRIPTNKI